MTDYKAFRAEFIEFERGVPPDDWCKDCSGTGVQLYGSTATWHGGIGGAAMTHDVCDKCWGSGSASKPWLSHRLLQRQQPR